MFKPEFVILALGTNDVLTQGRLGPYERLVSTLNGYRLVAVLVHEMPSAPRQAVLEANTRITKAASSATEGIVAATTDGVHLTTEDYQRWFAAIEKVACGSS
jgi:lysophospholipase L1-like esterase